MRTPCFYEQSYCDCRVVGSRWSEGADSYSTPPPPLGNCHFHACISHVLLSFAGCCPAIHAALPSANRPSQCWAGHQWGSSFRGHWCTRATGIRPTRPLALLWLFILCEPWSSSLGPSADAPAEPWEVLGRLGGEGTLSPLRRPVKGVPKQSLDKSPFLPRALSPLKIHTHFLVIETELQIVRVICPRLPPEKIVETGNTSRVKSFR